MADEVSRPLLDGQARSSSDERTTRPDEPRRSFELSSESTPLLHRHDDDLTTYGTERRPSATPPGAEDGLPSKRRRVPWPTVVSLALLTTSVLGILVFAFAAPAVVKEYAQEAAVFKPTALSIDSTTPDGVRARVQGDFVMDAGRVKSNSMRNFGRLVTWIAREIETGQSDVDVYLPEYGNVLIGNAAVPSIKVNIRNGRHNHVDFLTDLTAGDVKGLHAIAMDWIEGRLGRLSIKARATLHLKTGLIKLGTQTITDTITFEESEFPALPKISITRLNVHDANDGALAVEVLLATLFDSPVALTVPAMGFDVMVPNCSPGDPPIMVAEARTAEIQIRPKALTSVSVDGLVRSLPDELTTTCPGRKSSPLDFLVSSYIQGNKTTVFVRGADSALPETPDWIADFLRSTTVPLGFTGRALDNVVKNFTMTDTHFSLPDPFAEPNTPESQPTVSALVKVLIGLPKQMNLQVDVPQVKAVSTVYYDGEELGVLKTEEWQDANSTRVEDQDGSAALLVQSPIENAPLEVTDDGVLAKIVQEMLFGSKPVVLHVAASVDTKVSTSLGRFAVHGIPAEGNVPVKAPGHSIGHLDPRVVSLDLGNTTESSLLVSARMDFTNPTKYSATTPFVDVLMLYNDTAIAHIIAHNLSVHPGNNTNKSIGFLWRPSAISGADGVEAGRALLSDYISGEFPGQLEGHGMLTVYVGTNTSVTIKTYAGTLPAQPGLGKALSIFNISVPLPQLSSPDPPDGGENGKRLHFIQDATVDLSTPNQIYCCGNWQLTSFILQLHLLSSTAEFTLFSPLTHTTINVTSINATALYENEPVGRINHKIPFDVPPGVSHTPRLPVELDLGGVGYDTLRRALGQSLQMDAMAQIGVRIENYVDVVGYNGTGIGAKVRL